MPNAIDYSDKIWWMPKFSSGPKGGGGGGGQGMMNLLKMASYASMGAEANAADLARDTAKVDALNAVAESKPTTSAPVPKPEPKQTGWLQNAARGYRISMEPEMKAQQLQVQGMELKNKMTMLAMDGTIADQQAFSTLSDELVQNPDILSDPSIMSRFKTPQFQAVVGKMVDMNTRSLATKTKLADMTMFTKKLATLDPKDRAAIQNITPNPDGAPSPMQWQALSLAEEQKIASLKNQRTAAEIEAKLRGDVVTTTVTDKGVTETFRPAPGSSQSFKPEAPIDYPNGAKLIHVSPQRWQYIAPGGVSKEMSAEQLRAIAKDLMAKDENDPVAAQIMQKLSDESAKQIGTKAVSPTSTATPQRVLRYNPATQRIE